MMLPPKRTGPNRDLRGRWRALLAAAALAATFGAGTPFAAAQVKVRPKDLAAPYQEWLKLTTYIITDKERDVFLHLSNDRERDLFIQAFWRLRDPTPGTPENEFQAEHMKRFAEANRRYRSAREGWMTDRGRIYIILGPPISTEFIAGDMDVYPAEIWSYYGDTNKGMPTHFELVFTQYKNAGEFKLYDPVADGPARLLVKGMTDYAPSDYQAMYQELFKKQPDLALVAFSIIPGQSSPGYQPSLESTIYLAAILESPKKGLDESYATHFLNYKGVVSTEYLTNYMKSEGLACIVYDPLTGLAYCDFAVAPERLSVDYYAPKGEYFCAFQMDVSVRSGEKTILQYGKEYPLTIPESQIKDTEGMGFSIADSFPVIEGRYHLTVLLRNTAGKEFSVYETDIQVPPTDGPPRLVGPALGVKMVETQAGVRLPFQVERRKLNPDPKSLFAGSDEVVYQFSAVGLTEELLKGGRIEAEIRGASGDSAPQKTFQFLFEGPGGRRTRSFMGSFPAADLRPDYYEFSLTLKDPQGGVLDTQKALFIVSPSRSLPHPVVAAKSFPLANGFLYQYMLARQYELTGQAARAEEAYKRALAANPAYLQKVPDYAAFLVKEGKAEDALTVLETIKDNGDLRFQYHLLRGRALFALGRFGEAVQDLMSGNKIYNSDAGLLAALGACYDKLGEKQKALEALRASLKLNPDQPDVERLVREIEAKK
jgi:GWxTD domain-containing protein